MKIAGENWILQIYGMTVLIQKPSVVVRATSTLETGTQFEETLLRSFILLVFLRQVKIKTN